METYPEKTESCNPPGFITPLWIPAAKLANAYVPYQFMTRLYTPMKGLEQGTIFPELDRPYGCDPEFTVDA